MKDIQEGLGKLTQGFTVKKPEILIILEVLQTFCDIELTEQHIKRGVNTLLVRLLPSQKQNILKNIDEIIGLLHQEGVYIQKIQ